MKLNNRLRIEIISTIDELNQYLNGNVTTDSLRDTLEELQNNLSCSDQD